MFPGELREIKIELTQECPLACVHCSTNSSRKQFSALPGYVVFRVLREAAALGVTKVVFTGGEPLVSPHLREVVSLASSLGISPTVYTSGITDARLTPMSMEMAEILRAAGTSRYIFSVYSHRPEVHDSITRYGTHAATMSAVRNALAVRVPVEIHFVAMRRNFRDLPGIIDDAASIGVERVSVLRFVPQGRGRNIAARDDLDQSEFRELARMVASLRSGYPSVAIRAGSPLNILGLQNTPCNAAQDVLIINHRGEVFPCDAFKNVRYADPIHGSILHQSLQAVWTKSTFLNHVRGILAAEKGSTCRACDMNASCQSGCLAQKVIREGWSSVTEPDPSCLIQIQQQKTDSVLVQIAGD